MSSSSSSTMAGGPPSTTPTGALGRPGSRSLNSEGMHNNFLLSGSAHSLEDPLSVEPTEARKFIWNNRECTGIMLHKVLVEFKDPKTKHNLVMELLDKAGDQCVHERFHYQTKYRDHFQEGSGQAIHIAAAVCSADIVKLLIDRRADIYAEVTRDGKEHYNVLHAAVFAEGLGGKADVIRCLLEARCPAEQNLEKHYPLHKAFQVGCPKETIMLLKEEMRVAGLLKDIEEGKDQKPPLQVGIEAKRLTITSLAEVASGSEMSVKVFLKCEKRCIPPFFDRLMREDVKLDCDVLAESVTVDDVCDCLIEYQEAARSLLDALTAVPKVDNGRWHPLPSRVDFGARRRLEKFRNVFNPPKTRMSTYQPATRWEFKDVQGEPEWHRKYITGKWGLPQYDVDIKVCRVPDILCTKFFRALVITDNSIFDDEVVCCCMDTAWWGGAFKLNVLQAIVTLTGLVLLILEQQYFEGMSMEDSEADMGRRLRAPGRGGPLLSLNGTDSYLKSNRTYCGRSVADEFIGSRGVVDLLHELMLFAGFVRIGHGMEYFTMTNLWDFLRAIVAISFYWFGRHPAFRAPLILIYWMRILEVSFSESLMRELLPITLLVKRLVPSSVVCCIASGAFIHAKWVMHSKSLWPHTFYESFALLITQTFPAVADPDDDAAGMNLTLIFNVAAVGLFQLFFLNIFISVISEAYTQEKSQTQTSFLNKKCVLCYKFLLCAECLPNRMFSKKTAVTIISCGMAAIWIFVALCFRRSFAGKPVPPLLSFGFLIFCQGICILACYQDKSAVWSKDRDPQAPPRFMWVCSIVNQEQQRSALEYVCTELESEIQGLRQDLDNLEQDLIDNAGTRSLLDRRQFRASEREMAKGNTKGEVRLVS